MAKGEEYALVWHQMYPINPDNPRITPWGCVKDLICTLLRWWRGDPSTRHNSVQEPRLYQRVRFGWKTQAPTQIGPYRSVKRGSSEYHDKMESNHQLDVYLITDGGHANQWGIYKSRSRWGICPSVASRKIRWAQVIHAWLDGSIGSTKESSWG